MKGKLRILISDCDQCRGIISKVDSETLVDCSCDKQKARDVRDMLEGLVEKFNEAFEILDDDEDMPMALAGVLIALKEAKEYVE